MIKSLKSHQDDTLDYLVLLLFLSLPFHRNISTLLIVIILLVSIGFQIKKRTLPTFRISWFLPLLFFYYLISGLLTGGSWSAMEKRLLFLVVPIVFWLNPNFFREGLRSRIFWSYVIGIVTAEGFCLLRAIKNSTHWVNGKITFVPKVMPNTDYDFLTASIRDGNFFFGEDFSYFLHPIYFGLYIVLAQILIYVLFKKVKNLRLRLALFVLYFMQFGFLFLISSKAAIISSLLFAFYIAFSFPKQIWLKSIIAAVVLVFALIFVSLNPRMRIFKDNFITQLSINPNARFGHDLRILSWDASWTIIKGNWVLGVGEGRKDSELTDTYIKKGYVVPAREEFNSHNQYLDFLLGGGVIALGIYLSGILWMVYRAIESDNYILLIFVLLFSFEAFFENLLSRHAGVLLFAVFVTFLDSSKHDLKTN
jgi:O-antigen ligase